MDYFYAYHRFMELTDNMKLTAISYLYFYPRWLHKFPVSRVSHNNIHSYC